MKKTVFFLSLFFLLPQVYGATTEVVEFDHTQAGRERYFSQPFRLWGRTAYPVKPGNRGQVIVLGNNRIKYVFMLFGKEDASGIWKPFLGMFKPSDANWCSTGFLDFTAGGIKREHCHVSVKDAVRGGVTLVYKAPGYIGELHFEVRDNDDRLYMLFTTPLKTKILLSSYPSSYAGGESAGKHLRKRYVITPARRLSPVAKWITLNQKEYSIYLGDNYFDPAKKRGEGPCALIYDPNIATARVWISNYPCLVELTGKGKIPVVLFDFHGVTNANAEQRMKELPVSFSSSEEIDQE